MKKQLQQFARLSLIGWCAHALPVLADGYQLGQGVDLPWLGLGVGGYGNVEYSVPAHSSAALTLEDLSFFLHSRISDNWYFFNESEIQHGITLIGDDLTVQQDRIDIERLYVEYQWSTRATFRVGKFLTPIGRWNEIHAAPLVWSITRPLTTSVPFPQNQTGVQWYGTQVLDEDNALDYQLFGDVSDEVDPTPRLRPLYSNVVPFDNPPNAFENGSGLHVRWRTLDDALQIGTSLARFELQGLPGIKQLVGLDFVYTSGDAMVQGEAVYRQNIAQPNRPEKGGYLQTALPVKTNWYLVLTSEHFQLGDLPGDIQTNAIGITWRPQPAVAVKFEHRISTGMSVLAPSGWFTSVGAMF